MKWENDQGQNDCYFREMGWKTKYFIINLPCITKFKPKISIEIKLHRRETNRIL